MSYDHDEHTKEVFAHFGLAYYLSGVFEAAITNALLQLDFLAEQRAEVIRNGPHTFDRTIFEQEFDAFMERHYAKTLGNLIKRVYELADMDNPLKEAIAAAKSRRDFLAHHFFRIHAEDFARRKGRDKMLEELKAAQGTFESVDKQIDAYMKPIMTQLGMKPEVIEAYTDRYILAAYDDEARMPPC